MKPLKSLDKKIIAYVTGEMDGQDRLEFEQMMSEDTKLHDEVERHRSVLSRLAEWEDGVVSPPTIDALMPLKHNPSRILARFLWAGGIAASLLVLFFALAWLTNAQVARYDEGWMVTFGADMERPMDNSAWREASYTGGIEELIAEMKNEIEAIQITQQTMVSQIESKDIQHEFTAYNGRLSKIEDTLNGYESKQLGYLTEVLNHANEAQLQRLDNILMASLNMMDEKHQMDMFKMENAFIELVAALNNSGFQAERLMQNLMSANSE